MIVQIYEIKNSEEAKKIEAIGVDHIGMVVGTGKRPFEISFQKAKKIFSNLTKAKSVALTLDESFEDFKQVAEKVNPDIIHLCAKPEKMNFRDIKQLRKEFPKIKIMVAVPVINNSSIDLAKEYGKIADFLILDTFNKKMNEIGVAGIPHDWNISKQIVDSVKIPVILAGGLGPENVQEAIKKVRPAGVDSKTKTDLKSGKGKDLKKVSEFYLKANSVKN